MEKIKTGPKDFFLWVAAMAALYVSAVSLITLFFNYIDIAFPDALNSYIDPYSSSIRFAMASLVVLVPVYFILIHFIRRDVVREPVKKSLWIRRWALVLTIFIAGVTVVIDLITLINTFLSGELTTHFILKVLIVFFVMSIGLMHFLADLWGYWDINPRYAMSVGVGIGILVVVTILSGFLIIGTPGQVRSYRFDDEKVNDLQSIQTQVVYYWQVEGKLPAHLADLADALSSYSAVSVDVQTGNPYEYATTSALSFKLCATFNAVTQPNSPTFSEALAVPVSTGVAGQYAAPDSWYHDVGQACFVRTIDPKRYGPNIVNPAPTK